MTDPAILAAQRARAKVADGMCTASTERHRITAAREALAPIRALHVRTKNVGHCQNSDCPCFEPEWVCSCGEWHRDYEHQTWPCPTARACYSTEELEQMK